jgi:hypothetical protein
VSLKEREVLRRVLSKMCARLAAAVAVGQSESWSYESTAACLRAAMTVFLVMLLDRY